MGRAVNKLLIDLDGSPMILHLLKRLEQFSQALQADPIRTNHATYSKLQLILITRADEVPAFEALLTEARLTNLVSSFVTGGPTRQASVYNGLKHLHERNVSPDEPVLIHDAARCLIPQEALRAICQRVAEGRAAALAQMAIDTVRQVQGNEPPLSFHSTLDRATIALMQTPQGAPFESLFAAHAEADRRQQTVTDDVALLTAAGHTVEMVEGSPLNVKLTRPEDLQLAEALLKLERSTKRPLRKEST